MNSNVKKRLYFFLVSIITILIIGKFIFDSLKINSVYFFSPTDIKIATEIPNGIIRVGGMVKNNSLKKLSEKNCDWIIANDISKNDIGFESDFNKVSIYYKNKSEENLPKMKKSSLANEIVNRIISQLN